MCVICRNTSANCCTEKQHTLILCSSEKKQHTSAPSCWAKPIPKLASSGSHSITCTQRRSRASEFNSFTNFLLSLLVKAFAWHVHVKSWVQPAFVERCCAPTGQQWEGRLQLGTCTQPGRAPATQSLVENFARRHRHRYPGVFTIPFFGYDDNDCKDHVLKFDSDCVTGPIFLPPPLAPLLLLLIRR